MQICWDNLEQLKYSPHKGVWYQGTSSFIYKDACKNCGEPFLAQKVADSKFCSISCGLQARKHLPANFQGRKTTDYNPVRNRELKQQYKKQWIEIFNQHRKMACEKCGEDRFACLDFHHQNSDTKDFNLSRYLSYKPSPQHVDRMLSEVDKCAVLCANCHRVEHEEIFLSRSIH